jgi:hypothetical protein
MSKMRSVGTTFGLLASCVTAVAAIAFVACSGDNSGSTTPDSGDDATHHDGSTDSGGSDTGNTQDTGSAQDSSSNEAGNEAGDDAGNDAPNDAGDGAVEASLDGGSCAKNADCNGGADSGTMYCNFGDNNTHTYRAMCPSTGTCVPLPDASTCPNLCVNPPYYCGCSGATWWCPGCAQAHGDTVRYIENTVCH